MSQFTDRKRRELVSMAYRILDACRVTRPSATAEILVAALCTVKPRPPAIGRAPERNPPSPGAAWTRDAPPRTSLAEARLSGSIVLNWQELLFETRNTTVDVAGTPGSPWLMLFAALLLSQQLGGITQLPIEESDAAVLWALWMSRDDADTVPKAGLTERMQSLLEQHGYTEITSGWLGRIISRLVQVRCLINDGSGYRFHPPMEVAYY